MRLLQGQAGQLTKFRVAWFRSNLDVGTCPGGPQSRDQSHGNAQSLWFHACPLIVVDGVKWKVVMLRTNRPIPSMAIALFLLQGSATCAGQSPVLPDVISPPEGGTLNLLLANRRGYVIAADSRRTRLSPRT